MGCNEQLGRCGLSQITPHSIILSDVANESAAVNRSNDLDSEFLRPSLRSCLYVCHPISLAIKHMFHVNLVMNKRKLTQLYSRCCSVGSMNGRVRVNVCANAGIALQFNETSRRVDVTHNVC